MIAALNFVFGQNQYVAHFIEPNSVKTKIITDKLTGISYILDSQQITITAVGKMGTKLWVTDPWKDNHLMKYRVDRPTIVCFKFDGNTWAVKDEVIWIVYNNTQFGYIEKMTGKFKWLGQD